MIRKTIKSIKKALARRQAKQEQIRRKAHRDEQLKQIYEGLEQRGY